MALGDIVGAVLEPLLRFVGQVLLEGLLEWLIRWPGYLLCRLFKRDVDLNGGLVASIGVAFWVVVCLGAWGFYRRLS